MPKKQRFATAGPFDRFSVGPSWREAQVMLALNDLRVEEPQCFDRLMTRLAKIADRAAKTPRKR